MKENLLCTLSMCMYSIVAILGIFLIEFITTGEFTSDKQDGVHACAVKENESAEVFGGCGRGSNRRVGAEREGSGKKSRKLV